MDSIKAIKGRVRKWHKSITQIQKKYNDQKQRDKSKLDKHMANYFYY